jgi:hypothetical protein
MSTDEHRDDERDDYEDERELRGVWLSRLMFNPFVGWPAETRTFEEFVEASREC